GQDVYLIDERKANLNQIIERLCTKGYIIAQEFLSDGSEEEVRIIMMNGKILEENGEKAIIKKKSTDTNEFRNNLDLGGARPQKGELTPAMEHIAEVAGPKLVKDGLFLVGLDIIKDKLIEINVLSPGDLHHIEITGMTDFGNAIIDALEHKLSYKKQAKEKLNNRELATKE